MEECSGAVENLPPEERFFFNYWIGKRKESKRGRKGIRGRRVEEKRREEMTGEEKRRKWGGKDGREE